MITKEQLREYYTHRVISKPIYERCPCCGSDCDCVTRPVVGYTTPITISLSEEQLDAIYEELNGHTNNS